MKNFLFILCLLIFCTIITQKVLAENDNGNVLYDSNPFLVNYKMTGPQSIISSQNLHILESKKWTNEDVPGKYNGSIVVTFYEDGTGLLHYGGGIASDVSSLEWSIDSYGNLLFGVLNTNTNTSMNDESYYRVIWSLIDSDDETNIITVYMQLFHMEEPCLTFREGIETFSKG